MPRYIHALQILCYYSEILTLLQLPNTKSFELSIGLIEKSLTHLAKVCYLSFSHESNPLVDPLNVCLKVFLNWHVRVVTRVLMNFIKNPYISFEIKNRLTVLHVTKPPESLINTLYSKH